ncbi:MAG: CASTOR/POLLUX-related putative ion channel, partial [Actinomycetales bacterium]
LPAVISELVEANASRRVRAIVVLTAQDTVEVSEALHGAIPTMGTSRLVVRSGVPTRVSDLMQVNPQGAAAAIVLKPRDGSDAHVVKAVLALGQCVPELNGLTVVAEIDDPITATALKQALGSNLITITSKDIIARISAQVSRAAGLGAIYQELLDFEGDELYSLEVAGPWIGRSFGEALLASSAATIVGIRRGDGQVAINPDASVTLQPGDQLVGIAADDSVFHLDRAPVDWSISADRTWAPLPKSVERTLIIGWSDLAPLIGNEIEAHVAPGSTLHVMVAADAVSDEDIRSSMNLGMQSLQVHRGDPISGPDIEAVMQQGPFDHVMLLSERDRYSSDEADARTLLALLHVRRCAADIGGSHNIVAELLDPNDVDLGGKTEGDDFIVSQKLIGLLMAQLSESPHLADVFADLFNSEGSIVAMHPSSRYVSAGTYTFADVIRSAREWNVVPIGYRASSAVGDPASIGNGIRLNPPKDEPIVFTENDMIVVLSEP